MGVLGHMGTGAERIWWGVKEENVDRDSWNGGALVGCGNLVQQKLLGICEGDFSEDH